MVEGRVRCHPGHVTIPGVVPRSRVGRVPRWTVAAVAGVALVLGWSVSPWAAAAPPGDVVELADEATMTAVGRDLFYGQEPRLLDAADYAGRCPQGAVGCYSAAASSIVVYRPDDERLHGWVLTVAVHEMLHAAYDSLSPADRHEVDALLGATVAALDPDDPLLVQVELSVAGREEARTSEQFAYVGTQLAQVDPRLEAVYARFLDDRQAVVRAYTSTSALLVSMTTQVAAQQQVLDRLEAQGRTVEAAAQRSAVDGLVDDIVTLQAQITLAG